MDMFEPQSSGYGSNTSTAQNEGEGGEGGEDNDPMGLGFEESFYRDRAEAKLMDAALTGQNLLGMVDEGPTRGYGDTEDYEDIKKAREEFQGSALMDFFVDPTQLFASERHPALQEVLKVLSRSKLHRGILLKTVQNSEL